MAVFPENMNRLNVDDVPGSLSQLENYIGYIRERVEFSMRNMTRNVENAGISTVEMYILLTDVQNSLSALTSTVQSQGGDINALQSALRSLSGSLTALDGRVTATEGSLTALDGHVTAAEGSLTALDGRVTAAEGSLTALDGRVTALEGQEDETSP